MKKNAGIKLVIISSIVFLLLACNGQTKTEKNNSETMNILEIKKHIELQKKIELSENDLDTNHVYHYSDEDMNLALPLICEGLKKNGFALIPKEQFERRIKEVFGDIFANQNCKSKIHDKFYTVFADKKDTGDEFDYTKDNLFISKEYCFITTVPLLSDFVTIGSNNTYNVTLDQNMVCRNKYLFNDNQQMIPYLINNDKEFISSLVKKYGYTKEPAFNKQIMDEYNNMDHGVEKVGEIIFTKNCDGELEVRQDLLKYIQGNTSASDNKLLQDGLARYGYALYNKDVDNVFDTNNKPSEIFTLKQKRQIIAYITAIYDPLFHKYIGDNPALWDAATPIENIVVSDPGIIEDFEKNNFYNISGLKEIIAESNIHVD